ALQGARPVAEGEHLLAGQHYAHRPPQLQRLQLGADAEGRLLALGHQATAQTSRFEDFTEHVVEWSGMLYRCENLSLAYRLVPLDVYTPLD
ncbi:hypothetical protein ACV34L_32660, partial [Pseudomonas aeruginosa]